MNKIIALVIGAAVAVGGGSFYGGMKFQQSKGSGFISPADFQNLRNLSPEERQQRFQQMGGSGAGLGGQFGGRNGGGGATTGEIISKDDKSITIKLRDGGSKIVFYSASTEIGKFASGTSADIEIGKSVMINGSANSDGSITAQSIQIRPVAPVVNDNENGSEQGATKMINIAGSNFSFDLTEIKVKKGEKVKIIFNNKEGFHDWVIDEFNARTPKLQSGQTAEVEFVADKTGSFEYYCSIGSHRAMGMKGKLIVE